MPTPHERLIALFTTRSLALDLPIGTERRVKAYLHRVNAELANLQFEQPDEPWELCDVNDNIDIGLTLISLAEQALDASERGAGTRYDHATGRPVDQLIELPTD